MGRKIRYVPIDLILNSAKPSIEPPTGKFSSPTDFDRSLQRRAPQLPNPSTPESSRADESSCKHDSLGRASKGREKATLGLKVGGAGGPVEQSSIPKRDEASSPLEQHDKQALRCMPITPLLTPRPSPPSVESERSHSASGTTQVTPKAATFDLNQCNMQYHPLPRRPPPLSQHHAVIASDSHMPFGTAASFTLPARPPPTPSPLYGRRPIRHAPIIGKVYYMPDGEFFPTSIVHAQKRQDGFFKHPILVIGVEEHIVYFYALTKAVPLAIGELNMCLRMGKTTADEGPGTLKLVHGSPPLKTESWINLEQRFHIEWHNLDEWAVDIRVEIEDLWKLWKRIQELGQFWCDLEVGKCIDSIASRAYAYYSSATMIPQMRFLVS
jgi:hypothetical protein